MKTNITSSIAQKSGFLVIVTLLTVISVSGLTPLTEQDELTASPEPVKSVVYESVSAKTTAKSVFLNWKTVSEFNNSHFEVERSPDMINFKTVAVVLDGFTTEGTGKRYAYKEDIAVIKNGLVAYYRLKQFDANGNISYSPVVKVQ